MKKNKGKKTLIFLGVFLVLALAIVIIYFFIFENRNIIAEIFNTVTSNNDINDNRNGIYTYTDELDGTYFIYSGCSVSKIKNHILVKNDKYYLYRSSCMGTYYKGSGNTKDLTVSVTEDKSSYMIKYDDHEYVKDNLTKSLMPTAEENKNKLSIEYLDLKSLQLLVDETEFEGNFYNINSADIKNNRQLKLSFYPEEKMLLLEESISYDGGIVYNYDVNDFSNLPLMYGFGNNIAIIEKNPNIYNTNMYGDLLFLVSSEGIIYDLRLEFPITVNNEVLNYDSSSVFVAYSNRSRSFILLMGKDKKMCDDNFDSSNGDKVAYYEFEIKYNSVSNELSRPQYKRTGYMSEGCKYVNSIMGG